ncbi:MAG TPA: hypothetical protein PKH80_04260 [Methanofastidiosum sp.]|nr:hypothetical protein [Methanofastidiosum sp.]
MSFSGFPFITEPPVSSSTLLISETSVASQAQPVVLFQADIISFPSTNFFPSISIIAAVLHHLIVFCKCWTNTLSWYGSKNRARNWIYI